METMIVLFLLVGIWYLAQLAISQCANLGIFWIVVKEGEAVAVMRNKAFHKMLLRYTGHRFHGHLKGKREDVDNLEIYNIEVSPNAEAFSVSSVWSRISSVIFPIKGISWIGIPPFYKVHRYEFKWVDDHFKPRTEPVSWILVQKYVYGITLDKIELEGGIPYTIQLLVTMQVTNPAKALFRTKRYFDASIDRISGWARDEFSILSVDDFIAPTDGKITVSPGAHAGKKLSDALERILGSAKKELAPQFGVSVDTIQVEKIDPSDDELRKITLKKEEARQKALAAIDEAKGEAEAIRIVNEAAEKMSDKTIMLKGFDALKHAGANVTIIGKDLNLPAMFDIQNKGDKK